MATPNSVSTRFTLDGAQDAAQQLAQFGAAANEMVARVGKAVNLVSQSFAEIESGVVKIAKVAGVVSAVGGALFAWSKRGAEATETMSHLADQAGTTVENMSAMVGTLTAMSARTDELPAHFTRLAVAATAAWDEIRKSVKDAADVVVANQNKVVSSTLGVESAQLALFNARQKLAGLLGVTADPEIARAAESRAARLAVAEAEQRLAEAVQKRAEAAKKADEDQKNSIATVAAAVKSVTDGVTSFKAAAAGANLNVENIFKGLLVSAGPAVEQLGEFKGGLRDLATQAPNVQAVFLKLADFMKNSGDATLNTALAIKLFGRGVKQDLIDAMSQGSAAIKTNMERLKQLGLAYSEIDKTSAKNFNDQIGRMSFNLGLASNRMSLLFAPAFTEGLQKLSTSIEDNNNRMLRWAEDIAARVRPVILDFFKILTGEKIETPWVANLVAAVKTAADGFSRLEFVAAAALAAVTVALKIVAAVINTTFGTNLDAASVAMVLFAVKVLPVWASVAIAIGTVVGFIDNLTSSSSTANVAIEATGRRIAALKDLLAGNISLKAFKDLWTQIGEDANKSYQQIQAGTFKTGSTINSVFDKVRADTTANFNKLADDANSALQRVSAPSAPGAGAGGADGVKNIGDQAKTTAQAVALVGGELQKLGSSIKVISAGDDAWKNTGVAVRSVSDSFGELSKRAAEVGQTVGAETGPALAKTFDGVKNESNTLWQEIAQQWSISPINPEQWGPALKVWQADTLNGFVAMFDQIVSNAQSAWDRMSSIFGQPLPTPPGEGGAGGGGGGSGFARGTNRPLVGPGSWISDSIPAWVSRGEAILQAPSVDALIRHYGSGIVGLLNNFHKIDSSALFGKIPKFSLGALIDDVGHSFGSMLPIPRFAEGGMVPALAAGGGRQMKGATFVLDGHSFGFQGDADVVTAFERAAILRGIASTGKKPRSVG